jgi:general secretion pathway protein M
VWPLKREQTIAVSALALAFLACAAVPALTVFNRLDALQDLSDRQDDLSRLVARSRSRLGISGLRENATAPATAFLVAPTTGLAGADFQAYVERLANRHAALVSIAIRPTSRDDPPDAIRIEASLDISLASLQALLYQLESGVPYVFVESMSVRSETNGAPSSADDPLRVTLVLRSIWHRSAV